MLDIYIKLGYPSCCVMCRREIRIGQRVMTDGEHDFCDGACEHVYEQVQTWLALHASTDADLDLAATR